MHLIRSLLSVKNWCLVRYRFSGNQQVEHETIRLELVALISTWRLLYFGYADTWETFFMSTHGGWRCPPSDVIFYLICHAGQDTASHKPKNIRFTIIKCPFLQCDDPLTKCVGVFHQVPFFSQSVTPVSILHCITLRIFDYHRAGIEVLGLIPDIDVLRLIPLWSGPHIYHTPLLILLMHWWPLTGSEASPISFHCFVDLSHQSVYIAKWRALSLVFLVLWQALPFLFAGYWGSWIDPLIKQ